jgi:serine protease
MNTVRTVLGFAWALALSAPLLALAAPEARVIVAFKPDAALLQGEARPLAADAADAAGPRSQRLQRRADALAARAGRPLRTGSALTEHWQVLRAQGLSSAALAARLAGHPDIAWVVPDLRRRAQLLPNDPLYPAASRPSGPDAGQWTLRAPDTTFRSAINAAAAWDRRPTGGQGIVIAVLDTGVRGDHPDLQGRLLPGIDAVDEDDAGSFVTANDGDGRDTDASDPGDWITAAESDSGPLAGCDATDSSWHGTQVSTIAGALTNNGKGMAGVAFGAGILPVRVLGKCGGYDSDIIAGMLWAAGLEPVAGVVNANPARVLNLSLGGPGVCTQIYVDAVARINAAGAVVVASAGNDVGQAVGTPANCPGVIGVGGLRHAGSKVGFSDLGPQITVSAPGGNCVNITVGSACLYPILAGSNSGTQQPVTSIWTDSFNITVGTSFSSPIVAGTAALMLSGRPALTPAELKTALQASARPFPTTGADNGPSDPTPVPQCRAPGGADQLQCYCTTALCGAGMLDADAAVRAVDEGFAYIARVEGQPLAGESIILDGLSSLAGPGRRIVSYAWTLVDGGGIVNGFGESLSAGATQVVASDAGSFSVLLTTTDDQGLSKTALSTLTVGPRAPGSGGGGGDGGGGGAMGAGWLLALALAAGALRLIRGRA